MDPSYNTFGPDASVRRRFLLNYYNLFIFCPVSHKTVVLFPCFCYYETINTSLHEGVSALLTVSVLVLSTALLLAMVMNLILRPEVSARVSTVCMITAVAFGMLIYGTGYAESSGDLLLSVIRTPAAVLRMFVGSNDLSAIAGTTFVSGEMGLLIFWIVHLCAFYSMASAVMVTLGARLLRQLRILLSRRGDLVLIFGISENSISLGKDCLAGGGCSVVFAAENASSETIRDLNSLGLSAVTGVHASEADAAFLRSLHIRKRKLSVYAMDEDADRCLAWAVKLRDTLEKAGIPAGRTNISLPGAEDILAPMLQVTDSRYGFGFVHVFDRGAVAARALLRTCPPWELVEFDENGRAKEDFSCAVIGFGRRGQAVLRYLVQNGQFLGSTFHAAVFSPAVEEESGCFFAESPELFSRYDIVCFPEDGRSRFFYDYVTEHLSSLKMIAVCTGSEALNGEIADDLMLFLSHRNAERIRVVQCGKKGARYHKTIGSPVERTAAYTRAFLSAEEADRSAVILNAVYDTSERSDWEKWVSCPSFGRLSSRAAADFQPAFLRMSGTDAGTAAEEGWAPSGALLESLAETEHMRWTAFYAASGYRTMTREQILARAEEIARRKAEGRDADLSLTKDAGCRLHACMIPWDELDGLSRLVGELTGTGIDYKDADRRNVLALARILKAEK